MKWLKNRIDFNSLNLSDFWSKALLCLMISFVLLKFEEGDNYDIRFNLRPSQKTDPSLVLISIKPSDLKKMTDSSMNSLISINETQELSDSYFWDEKIWFNLLNKLLKANPKKIGVTLYFGQNLNEDHIAPLELNTFKNDKIIWATPYSDTDTSSLPFMAKADLSNVGYISNVRDDDGLIRRIEHINFYHTNFARKIINDESRYLSLLSTINYKTKSAYKIFDYHTIMSSDFDKKFLENKIILIGTENSFSSLVPTPIGFIPKHELWATILDNYINHQFILRTSTLINIFLLVGLLVLALLIVQNFPQSVSFIILIWLAILWSAFSLWIFDSFYYWIPMASPLLELFLIWILYTGHQALKIQKAHHLLQQEQKYASELEQLKNNFVSLISHDLKTPIAKIQAVIDRLDSENKINPEIKDDFLNLKSYSDELHRYIQSILKVMRLESREFQLVKESADINEVIENVLQRLTPLAQSKNIKIETHLEPLFLIEFDVTLITEVILNLIENAIKYTQAGGQVTVTTNETETEVLIKISDTGEGINLEDQDHIFKKFVRGKNQDLKSKGTGLGLYLVKYFVELHNGSIDFESTPQQGTTFYVRLPIDPVD